jgi:iron complex outermembrane receptor protein
MKAVSFGLMTGSFLLFSEAAGFAEDVKHEDELPEVVVKEKKILTPTKQAGESVYTGTEVTRRGMELSGEKGKTSVYEAMSILPGVVFESIDANNLAPEQSNVRIRGIRGYLGALTIEGIPNYGANPIGPRDYLYDLENFESLAVYTGVVPADLGAGVGNRAGAIELRPLWAKKNFGVTLSQALGNFDFRRTSFRLDSGEIKPTNSRLSLSYSYSEQDKWKGPGDLGPRHNLNLTMVQQIGKRLEIKLWANFNEIEYHKYRYLNYNQTKDLSEYYRLDFNSVLIGNPEKDYLYYKYNKEYHKNRDLYVSIKGDMTENLKLTLKPYIFKEDAKIWDGAEKLINGTRPGIQKRTRDIERKGFISEVAYNLKNLRFIAGYHYEASDMDIFTENYEILSGKIAYRGYGVTATSGTNYVYSPYFKLAGTLNNFNWQMGMKYFRFKDPGGEGYVTNSTGGTFRLVRAPDLDREGKTYDIWLPTAGVSYIFNEKLEAYLSYGRKFIRPYAYLPLVSTYNRFRKQFQEKGITFNDLFSGFDIERSDNVDLGLRIRGDSFEITPTIFYSRHKKLLVNVSDPRVIDPATNKPVNYQQNVGKAKGYGFEIATTFYLSEGLTFYFNPTYNRLTYDGDITYSGKTLSTDGKQVLDVPRWTVVTGLMARYKNFEIIPQLRYIGKRYGDVEHNEKISSYVVVDLKLSYNREKIGALKNLKVSLEFDNLFDKKYISVINAFDDTAAGRATYGVGAPFTARGVITFSF